jgi:hypothetical protein
VTNSFVRNNLIFNSNVKPLNVSTYDSNIAGNISYDQNYNVIEYNTFVVPAKNFQNGAAAGGAPNLWIGSSNGCDSGDVDIDMGNNTFRKNLFINYSGAAPLQYTSILKDFYGTYAANGRDTRPWMQTMTWQDNDFYALTKTEDMVYYTNTVAKVGSPPCAIPTGVQGYYNWSTWQGLNTTTSGNKSVDPQFIAYDHNWYATPDSYNFLLKPTSPMLGAGYSADTVPVGPALPTIQSFTASPVVISAGGSSVLSWSVSNAASLSINQGIGSVNGLSSVTVSPLTTTSYILTATNGAGSTSRLVTVRIPGTEPNPGPGPGPGPIQPNPEVTSRTLSAVKIYPNPWKSGRQIGGIFFSNLPENSSLQIFTLSGRLVRTWTGLSGTKEWNLDTSAGQSVASGLYLFLIKDASGEQRRGKIAILR